jgi:hypothetical protein
MLEPQNIPQFNQEVANWATLTSQALAFRLASLDLETQIEILQKARDGRQPLSLSVKTRFRQEFGLTEVISFSFWAHGWFYDKGVGKETPIEKAGSTVRVPKPWIDFVLVDKVENLADIIMDVFGDDVLEKIKIRR